MEEKEKSSVQKLIEASDLLPEPQRQRVLGIAEGIAIAASAKQEQKQPRRSKGGSRDGTPRLPSKFRASSFLF